MASVAPAGDEARELERFGAGWEGGVCLHPLQAPREVAPQEDAREAAGEGAFGAASTAGGVEGFGLGCDNGTEGGQRGHGCVCPRQRQRITLHCWCVSVVLS